MGQWAVAKYQDWLLRLSLKLVLGFREAVGSFLPLSTQCTYIWVVNEVDQSLKSVSRQCGSPS